MKPRKMPRKGRPTTKPTLVSRRIWPPIDAEKEAAISADLRLGKAGIMKVAAAHGVGVGTVQRIKAALAA